MQNMQVAPGPDPDSFVMNEAPRLPLVFANDSYARTVFTIIEDTREERGMAFIMTERGAHTDGVVPVQAINYDARYYEHDKDFINGAISAEDY